METKYLTRPNGRVLAYSEFGAPAGRPVLYCHGYPSSRLEAALGQDAAHRQGVRLIAADRPGMGGSDRQPGRRMTDWADDLAALADHLRIDDFGLIGVSGGAPFALLSAGRLGRRAPKLALACPLGPAATPDDLRGFRGGVKAGLALAVQAPRLSTTLNTHLVGPLMSRFPGLALALLRRQVGPEDRATLADPEVAQKIKQAYLEGLKRGARGAAEDLLLLTGRWAADVQALTAETRLWHGEADRIVPAAIGRRMAALIPGCESRFLPGEGHYSLPVRRMDEVLVWVGGNEV